MKLFAMAAVATVLVAAFAWVEAGAPETTGFGRLGIYGAAVISVASIWALCGLLGVL